MKVSQVVSEAQTIKDEEWAHLYGKPDPYAVEAWGAVEWRQEYNRERCRLITKEYRDSLTVDEVAALQRLQDMQEVWIEANEHRLHDMKVEAATERLLKKRP